ncbi:hypothetical protein AAP_01831 [Ascosphaera apis ARSEF 7405]|uniref:Uncharacterized protein n=1 Tax=Ascosphaera apis ARSEF 7405 TaxID=392613 RepID=A0A168AYP5_9EURO|nr:hypothetical protein AAP_01831 [Ascosphaera apis ARSEF 7405]
MRAATATSDCVFTPSMSGATTLVDEPCNVAPGQQAPNAEDFTTGNNEIDISQLRIDWSVLPEPEQSVFEQIIASAGQKKLTKHDIDDWVTGVLCATVEGYAESMNRVMGATTDYFSQHANGDRIYKEEQYEFAERNNGCETGDSYDCNNEEVSAA